VSALAAAVLPGPLGGRIGRRVVAALLAAVALAAVYMLWVRDAPVFAVDKVKVEGIDPSSPGREDLQRALTDAARGMTTLHVRTDALREAAARFPLVAGVSAAPDFPDGLTVKVVERRPVALIGSGSVAAVVTGDGTIVRAIDPADFDLPQLTTKPPPARERLVGTMLDRALVLGAAPTALLRRVEGVAAGPEGVVVTVGDGIELRFGEAKQIRRKWLAAAAVLADPALTAVDYVDLTSPRRPATGGAGHYLPAAP
jgi:cell division protein FtsQ